MNSNLFVRPADEAVLTSIQHEVLVGNLLGDGGIYYRNQNSRRHAFQFGQGSRAHEEYVDHVYRIFEGWVRRPPHTRTRNFVLKTGELGTSREFVTISHPIFDWYAQAFYRNGKKGLPLQIEDWITPRTVAYWYMDDGSIKSKDSKGLIFNTQGFTKEEVEKLASLLESKLGLAAWPRSQGQEGWQIYVSGKSFARFMEVVAPYIIPSMMYKVPPLRVKRRWWKRPEDVNTSA